MMSTTEAPILATYATVTQAAAACGVNERRVRNWQNLGLLVPAARVGLIQFRLVDVVRCAVLLQLQAVLGQDSALAVEIARGLEAQQLEALMSEDDPRVNVLVERVGRRFLIGLDSEELAVFHERLATIPR
jgi:hypothetical protein